MVAIKGHFDGKVFVPDEPVELPRGQAVTIHVQASTAQGSEEASESASDAWDVLARHAGSVSAPADWSEEHDHYLYGTPKRSSSR